ncbi:MAG: Rod shape-determining protein MreD [Phycisphaerales bacterium]|nr:Rod shape-determining protein MreD [Phycisphaerales bacterium]
MRWLPFFILAYIVLGLQLGVGAFVSWQGAQPNLVLIAAVYVAVNAPRDAGLFGAFLLGLGQDLIGAHPPGLYALSYGLAALLVVGSRQLAYNDHPLSHLALALGGGLITAVVLYVHGLIRPPGQPLPTDGGEVLPALRPGLGMLLLGALYTAALAPLALWLLGKTKPIFGFRSARSRPRYG